MAFPRNCLDLSKRQEFLKPCPELAKQARQFAEAWKKENAKNEPLKGDGVKLENPPFYHTYAESGEKEAIPTVRSAVIKVANTHNKPDAKLPPDLYDAEIQKQADEMCLRLFNLNSVYPDRPEVFEYAVYHMTSSFITTRLLKVT